ncbi:MAG TPA: hypothetical protein VEI57_17555 [Nitrospirota bacterium]|nr:hypothetical protein [Nitrospirota bacterium]
MKNFVVSSLEVLTGVIFFIIIIGAMLAGYRSMVWVGQGLLGAIIGLVGGGIVAIFTTGIIYLLLSINANLVSLNALGYSAKPSSFINLNDSQEQKPKIINPPVASRQKYEEEIQKYKAEAEYLREELAKRQTSVSKEG